MRLERKSAVREHVHWVIGAFHPSYIHCAAGVGICSNGLEDIGNASEILHILQFLHARRSHDGYMDNKMAKINRGNSDGVVKGVLSD